MIKDKIVFISGASSGIGESTARLFAAQHAHLILCARNLDKLTQLREELSKNFNVKVHTLQLDIRNHEDIRASLLSLPEAFKNIDILINNAGLAAGLDKIQDGQISDWEIMIDTNLKGLLYLTKAIIPTMIHRQQGHIINIGSIAGHEVYEKGVVYCATKHAVRALTQGLRHDLLGTHIRITSIDPGAVQTNFSMVRFKGNKERAEKVYEGFIPLTAEDIADAILYSATRPLHVNISEMIIMPTAQAAISKIHREV
jgi:NADP-dependent 3-hydroxy acid dehydrogenase YdfG